MYGWFMLQMLSVFEVRLHAHEVRSTRIFWADKSCRPCSMCAPHKHAHQTHARASLSLSVRLHP